jgi:hypothetical protein
MDRWTCRRLGCAESAKGLEVMAMRPSTLQIRALLLQSPGVLALIARTTGCTEQELIRALAGEAVFDAARLAQVESYIRHVYGLSA